MEQEVSSANPIDLLFGGMEKLGPGADADTLRVLETLPRSSFPVIVDAGCGAGRQTLALARRLNTTIHAVDSYEPFLQTLQGRAEREGLQQHVAPLCLDMQEIPLRFPRIDLLWSEGAAYNIGFAKALATWAAAIPPGGFAVVSELCWLRESAPSAVKEFFDAGYPDMASIAQNATVAQGAGYRVDGTHVLPREAWIEDYYDVLEPRAKELAAHPDSAVREFAQETLREIEVFNQSEDSYGYVFFILQRT